LRRRDPAHSWSERDRNPFPSPFLLSLWAPAALQVFEVSPSCSPQAPPASYVVGNWSPLSSPQGNAPLLKPLVFIAGGWGVVEPTLLRFCGSSLPLPLNSSAPFQTKRILLSQKPRGVCFPTREMESVGVSPFYPDRKIVFSRRISVVPSRKIVLVRRFVFFKGYRILLFPSSLFSFPSQESFLPPGSPIQ